MRTRDTRVYQSSRRMEGFVEARPSIVPPEVAGQVTALKEANTRIGDSFAEQDEQQRSWRAATAIVHQRRVELRQYHLLPIAAVARSVVDLTPELRVALRVPKASTNVDRLLAAAVAMARIGEQHQQVLVAHGLHSDFVASLRQAEFALRQALDERDQIQIGRVNATQSVRGNVAAARLAGRALDVALTRALRGNPPELAEWRSAKRVPPRLVREETQLVKTDVPTTRQVA